jgi:catechol 2,3-dioxygenase-like lactoylglutathione lyase family enzyme
MVKHLSAVILVSERAPALAAFYREVLGVPLVGEQHAGGGEALHFGCTLGGLHFAVHPVENWPYAPEVGPGGARLAFRIDDADASAAVLAKRAVRFEGPIDEGWARMIRLRDPDGNYVELVQRVG